jgi:RimJ/RimL family protein N-acetyltransferase
LLEGKNVNLRVTEKEDLQLLTEWWNDPKFTGEYLPFPTQDSRTDMEKMFEKNRSAPDGLRGFIVEKKDGTRIGNVTFYNSYIGGAKLLEIGYMVVQSERGKGYGTEAAQLMVDYLFLSMDIGRIQASTSIKNTGSQRVLEKAGFTKEGTIRKSANGVRRDSYLYSILREEWKEPKILTKIAWIY